MVVQNFDRDLNPSSPSDDGEERTRPSPKYQFGPSTRLLVAIVMLFATWNFMFQRLIVNFGLVCMVKLPSQNLHNNSNIIINSTFVSSSLSLDSLNQLENEHDFKASLLTSNYTNNVVLPDIDELETEQMFEWSVETQGRIFASYFYGCFLSQLPGAWWCDKLGPKRTMIIGGVLLSMVSFLSPIASIAGSEYFIGLRFIAGIINGGLLPAINTLATQWFPDTERSLMMGIAYSGFPIATAIGYPISAFFCAYTGWQGLFYGAGLIGLAVIALCQLFVYNWPEDHWRMERHELILIRKSRALQYGETANKQNVAVPWFNLFTSIPIWAISISNFCCIWILLTVQTYLPMFLQQVMHLKITENGLLSSIPFIITLLFHFVAAILFDFIYKKKLCSTIVLRKIFNTGGTFLAALLLVLVSFLGEKDIVGAIAIIALSQAALEFAFMGGYLFSMYELAPLYASQLGSVVNTFGLLAGLGCAPLTAYLTKTGSHSEWMSVFNISAVICAIGGFSYLILGKAKQQPWANKSGQRIEQNETEEGMQLQ